MYKCEEGYSLLLAPHRSDVFIMIRVCLCFRCRRSRSLSETSFPSTSTDQRRRTSDGIDFILHRDVPVDLPVPSPSTRPTSNSMTSTAPEKTTVHLPRWSACYTLKNTEEYWRILKNAVIWCLWYWICFMCFQSPPSSPDEENIPDGLFVFRRKAGCQYLSVSFFSFILNWILLNRVGRYGQNLLSQYMTFYIYITIPPLICKFN